MQLPDSVKRALMGAEDLAAYIYGGPVCATEGCENPTSKLPRIVEGRYGHDYARWCDECFAKVREKWDHDTDAAEAREAYREWLANESRIPDLYRRPDRDREGPASFANFQTIQNAAAKATCARYAKSLERDATREGLFLIGPVGTGKSHLAAAVLMEVGRGLWVPSLAMVDGCRPGNDKTLYTLALAEDLIVLDDVGTEVPSPWVQERMLNLIDRRYTRKLPTIITTNTTMNELEAALGERTVSRIMGMCHMVRFEGLDYRTLQRSAP